MNFMRPHSIAILGFKGQGKSLFVRNLLINLKQLEMNIAQKVKI